MGTTKREYTPEQRLNIQAIRGAYCWAMNQLLLVAQDNMVLNYDNDGSKLRRGLSCLVDARDMALRICGLTVDDL